MGITGNEVRISSRYLSAKLGTYTFTSPYNSNRNIAYNTDSTRPRLSSNNVDYSNEIYSKDTTLGSLKMSTYYYNKSGNENSQLNSSNWNLQFPTMSINTTNLTSVKFYTSLRFDEIRSGRDEFLYLQIKRTNEAWELHGSDEIISQSFLYMERNAIFINGTIVNNNNKGMRGYYEDNEVYKVEVDLTSTILSYNGSDFNIRFYLYNFQDNDFVELGSYLLEYTYN